MQRSGKGIVASRLVFGFGIVCIAAGLAMVDSVSAQADGLELGPFSLRGFVEERLASTGDAKSWENGGLGKTSFGSGQGSDARVLAHVQGAALVQAKINWDVSVIGIMTVDGRQHNTIDAQELFVRYKPAPTSNLAIEAKVGIFFPPISLENTALGWTSPYTLSSSAINSWVGDELRGLGGEFSATRQVNFVDQLFKIRATGGLFGHNDPAGSLLAYRGWSIDDHTAGVFEHFPISPLKAIGPDGTFPKQAPWVEPFHNLDGRPGYYVQGSLEDEDRNLVRATYYDNRADSRAFDGRQYAWHTHFLSLGAQYGLPDDIDLLAQAMTGRTTMNLRPPPLGPVVDMDFSSAFVLASRTWDSHRISMRIEYFDTHDLDHTPDDNNAERGNAITLAYTFRPAAHHRFTVELVRVYSNRGERVFEGLTRSLTEAIAQASWRFSF